MQILQVAPSSSVAPAVENPLSSVNHLEPNNILEVVEFCLFILSQVMI